MPKVKGSPSIWTKEVFLQAVVSDESGKAVPNVTCEKCGKEMKPWSYARWHGDNCNER